jgi:excisionase family DNA binding protein
VKTTANPPGIPTPPDDHDASADRRPPQLSLLPVTTTTATTPSSADDGQPAAGVDAGALPPTLSVEQAAAILGCGRTLAYALVRRGEFPCKVLRLGNRYVIPTADLLRAIGIGVRAAA